MIGDDELFNIDLSQTIKADEEGKPDIFHNPFSANDHSNYLNKKAKAEEMEFNPFEGSKSKKLSPIREYMDNKVDAEASYQMNQKPYDPEERLRQLGILKLKPKRNSVPAYQDMQELEPTL